MARLVTSGGEIRDHPTADINSPDGWTVGAAATTTDLTTFRSGKASILCAGTAASTSFRAWAFTAPALGAQVYGRAHFQVDALPAVDAEIADLVTGANANLISVRLTTAGTVQLWNEAAAAQIGVDSTTVITPGQWYRLQLRLLINTGAVDQAELLISDDGAQAVDESISGTALTVSDTHAARFRAGWLGVPGATVSMWLDDLAVNDSTGTKQNTFAGDGRVIVLPCGGSTAVGSWTNCAGGTTLTTVPDYLDNLPPNGLADHS